MVRQTDSRPRPGAGAAAHPDNTVADVRSIAARVHDPEIPVITIEDLGVLQEVTIDEDGHVSVTLIPTYSGCPAMAEMSADVRDELAQEGFIDVSVSIALSPAWTTDMITPRGRKALHDYGIAPPGAGRTHGPVPVTLSFRRPAPHCPRCGSERTEEISRFGSTACKSLFRCLDCLEPFDYFKAL